MSSTGVEFQHRRFSAGVQAVQADTAPGPHLPQIGVTETVLQQQADWVDAVLKWTQALEVRISLDDPIPLELVLYS